MFVINKLRADHVLACRSLQRKINGLTKDPQEGM